MAIIAWCRRHASLWVIEAATSAGIMPARTAPAARLPTAVAFQIATARSEPPAGDGWLYEVKHDGHRLAVVTDGDGGIRLLSRNGYERSRQFGPAFADLARRIVLEGEIAAPAP
jgi:ATP-dependent DNA ligase